MLKEQKSKPYINQDGVLESLPIEQISLDELVAEARNESRNDEDGCIRTAEAIGALVLHEQPTEPTSD